MIHSINLENMGGAELQCVDFVIAANSLGRRRHSILNQSLRVDKFLKKRLSENGISLAFESAIGPLSLPRKPNILRYLNRGRRAFLSRNDTVFIWNGMDGNGLRLANSFGGSRCIHWERGGAWHVAKNNNKKSYLSSVNSAICNSVASKRMLQLRWGYTGEAHVVLNGARPTSISSGHRMRRAPRDGRVQLGVAARLVGIKGIPIAIHALSKLMQRGIDAELTIAGDGPENRRLQDLAQRTNVGDKVRFLGVKNDLESFYCSIDFLLVPSLRESFGQVVLEAGSYGVPSVVSSVDGLPEVVKHQETGICVAPDLPISDYVELGAEDIEYPPCVYDPGTDSIREPRVIDPEKMAESIKQVIDNPQWYESLSTEISKDVRHRFNFRDHVSSVLQLFG